MVLGALVCGSAATTFACPTVPDPAAAPPPPSRKPRIIVEVVDYLTGKPLPGVTVQITHDQTCTRDAGCTPTHRHRAGMLAMAKKTDARGRATFAVPDLDYGFHVSGPVPSGYLDYSSVYQLGAQACHELVREVPRRGREPTRRTIASLVPATMLTVTTPDQAIAIAEAVGEIQTWRASHPGITPTARGGGSAWQVVWAVGDRAKRQVHVNAFDGSASVSGRWTD